MKIFSQNNTGGSITLELLIAFAILLINVTAVMLIINSSQSISVDTETNTEALYGAQNLIEQAKADSRLDFNLVNPIPSFSEGIYQKGLSVKQIDLFTKQLTSLITWKTDGGRDQKTQLTTLITNPEAVNGGDTCSSVLDNPDGWKNPTYYTFSSLDFLPNGINMSDVDAFNGKLYITASKTPNASDKSFFILQIPNDPNQPPTILGSVDNNGKSMVGLNAVKVAKDYAYVANAYAGSAIDCIVGNNCAQLQIIDISHPQLDNWNPIITNLKIPVANSNSRLATGKSIFYSKGYVYMGLTAIASTVSNDAGEFNVIDVGGGGPPASPTNPILKGHYYIGNDVNSIFVKDNYAYIASPNTKNLIILNISDPNNPSYISGYIPKNGLTHGEKIIVIGNTAYLGRTFGAEEFQILDIFDPSHISIIAAKDIGTSSQTSVYGLIIKDYLTFIITLGQFQVWNISNTSNITPWSPDGTINTFLPMSALGGTGTAADCEGDRIYVAVASSQGNYQDILAILTSQ